MELMAVPKRKVNLFTLFLFLNIKHLIAIFRYKFLWLYFFYLCLLMFRIWVCNICNEFCDK
jgi:hypothetical protein